MTDTLTTAPMRWKELATLHNMLIDALQFTRKHAPDDLMQETVLRALITALEAVAAAVDTHPARRGIY